MKSVLVSPGLLIDALITTNIKLSIILQDAYDPNASDEEVGRAKRKICILNDKRNKLIEEIDRQFHDWFEGKNLFDVLPIIKDYSKKEKK